MARTDPQVNFRIPAELKDKLDNKKQAKEHFILAQFYRSKASRKYIGGTFVPRKGDGIFAYILEIPKESPGNIQS